MAAIVADFRTRHFAQSSGCGTISSGGQCACRQRVRVGARRAERALLCACRSFGAHRSSLFSASFSRRFAPDSLRMFAFAGRANEAATMRPYALACVCTRAPARKGDSKTHCVRRPRRLQTEASVCVGGMWVRRLVRAGLAARGGGGHAPLEPRARRTFAPCARLNLSRRRRRRLFISR